MYSNMRFEQKKMLYEIACVYIKCFELDMKDYWTDGDSKKNNEYKQTLIKLEDKYKNTFGDLPEWEYINNVYQAKSELERQLQNTGGNNESNTYNTHT